MTTFKIVHSTPYSHDGVFRIDSVADVPKGPLVVARTEFKVPPTEAEIVAARVAHVQELHTKVPEVVASGASNGQPIY
jgi:hypothetical protein